MHVLVRASTVLIDAPYLLNLECNHYINNSKTLKEIVLYNGLEKDRWSSLFGSRDQIRISCYRTCSSCWHKIFGSSPHEEVKHRLCLPLNLCSHMGIVILNLGCYCFIAYGVAKLFCFEFVTATSGVRICLIEDAESDWREGNSPSPKPQAPPVDGLHGHLALLGVIAQASSRTGRVM